MSVFHLVNICIYKKIVSVWIMWAIKMYLIFLYTIFFVSIKWSDSWVLYNTEFSFNNGDNRNVGLMGVSDLF